MGFQEISQELSMVQKNGIIGFFYIDDIVFAYKKDQKDEIDQVIKLLQKTIIIKKVGELKWFLGLHVVCNQTKQTIWPSQKAYITKIYNKFTTKPTSRLSTMPMDIAELPPFSDKKKVCDIFKILYQQKVGSFLFVAITIRPDIAFAVSRLSQFNQRPGKIYHEIADQVFYYFLGMQDYYICYGGETQDISSFVYASDALFADNLLDRKSF
ncbi:hypothetical protein [uncultured Nostoc sp.]|uniref:hypothetical protein n=1 Tax=uncultured Nostoc sp. TaxID=340711 RepID=UPI0035CBF705